MSKLLFFGLSFIVILSLFSNIYSVGAVSWISGFGYRKSHVINALSGAGTNYQVMITTYYGTGSDSVGNVYLNNKTQTDFDDVRFTKSDGTTSLDYYRESYVASTSALFWVELADNITSSSSTIYLYYGNATCATTSNGEDTFQFFDDFDDASLNATKWVKSGTVTEGSGYATIYDSSYIWQNTTICASFNRAVALRMNAYTSTTAVAYPQWGFTDINGNQEAKIVANFYGYWTYSNPTLYNTANLTGMTTMATYDITWNTSRCVYYQNGYLVANHALSPTNMFVQGRNYGAGTKYVYIDFAFVRKWVFPEPTQSTWGSEETAPSFHAAESWSLKLYNFTWYLAETWLGKLYNFSWYQAELWNLLLRNSTWFTAESWLLNLYNFSWSTAESWIGNLYNFSWYPVETFLGTLYNFTWYNAEAWLLNLYNYTWYSAETWTLLLQTRDWFAAETWNILLQTRDWFTSELWEGLLRNSTFMNVESWNGNLTTIIWNLVEEWTGRLYNFTWYSAESWIGELLTRNWFTSESWLGLLRNSTFMNVESWNGLLVGRLWFAVETFTGMLYGFVHDYLVYVGIGLGVAALGMVIVYSINDERKKRKI